MAKIYTIRLADKAAFLNKLKSLRVPVSNSTVKDKPAEGVFVIKVTDPRVASIVHTALKSSPDIQVVKVKNTFEDYKSL